MYPAYSSHLSSCDFLIFGILKEVLKDYMFTFDREVQDAVVWWLRRWLKESLADGKCWLMHQWDSV